MDNLIKAIKQKYDDSPLLMGAAGFYLNQAPQNRVGSIAANCPYIVFNVVTLTPETTSDSNIETAEVNFVLYGHGDDLPAMFDARNEFLAAFNETTLDLDGDGQAPLVCWKRSEIGPVKVDNIIWQIVMGFEIMRSVPR